MNDEVERLIQEAACCRDFGERKAIVMQWNVAVTLLPPRDRERETTRFIDALYEHRKR